MLLVLSDTQSTISSRRASSISSHMANTNTRSRRSSIVGRQSSIMDVNENRQAKQQSPVKVLVVNGKCSEIFKSTLEDCVEECILEFDDQNSIYVSKSGQAMQIPNGSRQTSALTSNLSTKSNRRKTGSTQFTLPQVNGSRTSQTSNPSLSGTTLTTTTSAPRIRHQLSQPKFSFADNISEEGTDIQTTTKKLSYPTITEPDSVPTQTFQEDTSTRRSNTDSFSQSASNPYRKPILTLKRDHQRDYRLSDLVMLGPEYFAHVFNLPRTSRYTTQTPIKQRSNSQQRRNKIEEKKQELDQIKQDLFHRYLWTQKPQVSCRIRPLTTYARNTTFVI